MRHTLQFIAVLLVILFAGLTVQADVGGTAKFGTTGIGADVTFGVAEKVNVRAGLSALSFDIDESGDDGDGGSSEIEATLDLSTLGVILDWHPWDGAFRLSVGGIINNTEIDLTADVSDSVEINDVEYSISDLNGLISFNDLAPYLGLGWGNAIDPDGNWSFACDIGLMLQGAPEVELDATASNSAIQALLAADLDAEAADLEDDMSGFDMYPVFTLGISRRF